MRSEMKKEVEHLDQEFREILVAIVGSRDGAGVKKCVEWLKHGRVSGQHESKRDASVTRSRVIGIDLVPISLPNTHPDIEMQR